MNKLTIIHRDDLALLLKEEWVAGSQNKLPTFPEELEKKIWALRSNRIDAAHDTYHEKSFKQEGANFIVGDELMYSTDLDDLGYMIEYTVDGRLYSSSVVDWTEGPQMDEETNPKLVSIGLWMDDNCVT